MASFQHCAGGLANIIRQEKKNEVCELERKRSVLNALLAISLTFPLWNSWLRISHCHCSGSGLCCGAGSVPDSGTSACWGHGHKKKKKKKNLLFNQKEMGVVHCFEKLSYLHTHSQFSMCCRYCSKKKKKKHKYIALSNNTLRLWIIYLICISIKIRNVCEPLKSVLFITCKHLSLGLVAENPGHSSVLTGWLNLGKWFSLSETCFPHL